MTCCCHLKYQTINETGELRSLLAFSKERKQAGWTIGSLRGNVQIVHTLSKEKNRQAGGAAH
jgi:phosphoribosyl-AMP cyclohydrolase